jgi:hypothetical protein
VDATDFGCRFWRPQDAGKGDLDRSRLLHFAKSLKLDNEIVPEATGNSSAIVRLLSSLGADWRQAAARPWLGLAL